MLEEQLRWHGDRKEKPVAVMNGMKGVDMRHQLSQSYLIARKKSNDIKDFFFLVEIATVNAFFYRSTWVVPYDHCTTITLQS